MHPDAALLTPTGRVYNASLPRFETKKSYMGKYVFCSQSSASLCSATLDCSCELLDPYTPKISFIQSTPQFLNQWKLDILVELNHKTPLDGFLPIAPIKAIRSNFDFHFIVTNLLEYGSLIVVFKLVFHRWICLWWGCSVVIFDIFRFIPFLSSKSFSIGEGNVLPCSSHVESSANLPNHFQKLSVRF